MTRQPPDRAVIVLRPFASPLALGFLALGGATTTLAGCQLGWYPATELTAVGLILVVFAFPLQILASVFAFLSRDVAAATGMGVLGVTWSTIGAVKLVMPPGSTSAALGVLVLFAGVALVIPAVAAAFSKVAVAAVLGTAAVRFALSGAYQVTGSTPVQAAAGVMGLILLAIALYAAAAVVVEDASHRTLLPVLRRKKGAAALHDDLDEQLVGIEHEAGVRKRL